jgi:hypothetical protein
MGGVVIKRKNLSWRPASRRARVRFLRLFPTFAEVFPFGFPEELLSLFVDTSWDPATDVVSGLSL